MLSQTRFYFGTLLGFALLPLSAAAVPAGKVVAWGGGMPGSSGIHDLGQSTVPSAALSNVTAVAAGEKYTIALRDNGTLLAWGGINNLDPIAVPPGISGVVALAKGGNAHHVLVVKSDGTLVGWGWNGFGQITGASTGTDVVANPVAVNGQTLTGVVAAAVGFLHSIALLDNGTVVTWGNVFSPGLHTVPPGLTDVVAIAAGAEHNLALKSNGTVVAWGSNSQGESTVPTGLANVVAIAAGDRFSLALKSDGTVAAWGMNSLNQVSGAAGLTDVVAIAAGSNHGLARKSDGTIVAWGWNFDGQTTVPTGAFNCPLDLAAGAYHSVVLSTIPPTITADPADAVRLAGQNVSFTVTASGTTPFTYQWYKDSVPLSNGGHISGANSQTLTLTGVSEADEGDYTVAVSNCAGTDTSAAAILTVNPTISPGRVRAWGDNSFGQTTVPTAAMSDVVAISAGQGHTVALKSNGTVIAWGWNTSGQTNVPPGLTGVVSISAGQGHTVVSKNNGTVLAWGNNAEGQTNVPTNLGFVTAVAAGGSHTLALHNDGTVVGWGYNGFGQRLPPPGLNSVIAIAAGMYHSVALKSDGTVVAWGDNSAGQCDVPPGLTGAVAIAAGFSHTLVLLSNGSVVAFGAGATNTGMAPNLGQSEVPISLTNGFGVAAGRYHSLALMNDKTVTGWGDNSAGQTTIPSNVQNIALAIAAGWMHNAAIVIKNPTIFDILGNVSVLVGEAIHFDVLIDGTPPFDIQWKRQSALGYSNIPGATGARLELTDVQASQAGNYVAVVSNPAGSVTSSPIMLKVIQPTTYADWMQTKLSAGQAGNPDIAGPLANPSGDGLPNLLKYAFDLDPLENTSARLGGVVTPVNDPPVLATVVEDGKLVLVFQAIRSDVEYIVEACLDPAVGDWNGDGVAIETNGTHRRATFDLTGHARAFLRLRIEQPGPLAD